ncbi:phosphotransferase enzyme family protein [Seiridium cupressi]
MAPETPDQIRTKVIRSLENTRYATSSLEPLTGGIANCLYHARLTVPLEDGTAEVAVKHGEGYVVAHPDTELPLDRCKIEEACLKAMADFWVTVVQDSVKYIVRTPECYFYDEKSNTQILEYLPNGIDLKTYIRKNIASPTPSSYRLQFQRLGKAIAQWIVGFHQQTEKEARDALSTGHKSKLYAELEACESMQKLKFLINYDWLIRRIDLFPHILEEAREVFEEFRAEAKREMQEDLMPIHGDFWTGNIVIGDVPMEPDAEIPVFVIDWEMAQLGPRVLDIGQMMTEMYALWLYPKIDAGLWMVQGFAEELALKDQKAAFRVAAQLGCHIVAFETIVPGWGMPEQVEEVARIGRDIIVHARKGDRDWFDKHDLSCLFAHVNDVEMPAAEAQAPLCNRCKTSPSAHNLRGENVCSQCFSSFVSLKAIKRLEQLQRETREGRGPPTTQRYLLALSPGGVSCTALLNILWENLRQQRERGQKVRFEILVAVIDIDLSDASSASGGGSVNAALEAYKARFGGIGFTKIGLADATSLDTIDWTALPELNADLPPSQRIADLFARLPSASSRADILRLFTRHLLMHTAVRESCDVLLMGYNTTSLAELTLSETAKGRGFAVPWGVNDGILSLPRIPATKAPSDAVEPSDIEKKAGGITIPIYSPLRELFRKELLIYSGLTTPALTPLISSSTNKAAAVVSHKDVSIDDVMARYFAEVEENYPSVVANVVRTTGKLRRSGNSETGNCGLCGLGLDEVGDERWRGELGEQKNKGGDRGRLCYGCERSVYG